MTHDKTSGKSEAEYLAQQLRMIESMLDILQVLASGFSDQQSFAEIIDRLQPVVAFRDALVLSRNPETNMYEVIVSTYSPIMDLSISINHELRPLLSGVMVNLNDITHAEDWVSLKGAFPYEVGSAFHIPILGSLPRYILILTHSDKNYFDETIEEYFSRLIPLINQMLQAKMEIESKAESIEQMRRAFIETMSHELRTPANALMGHLHWLKDQVSESELSAHIMAGVNAAQALVDMIEDLTWLLDKPAGEKLAHDKEKIFSPLTLFYELNTLFQTLVKNRSIEMQLEVSSDRGRDLKVRGSARIVRRVWMTLWVQALRAAPEKDGRVRVKLEIRKDDLRGKAEYHFCVADNGPPIPEAVYPVLFEGPHFYDAPGQENSRYLGHLPVLKKMIESINGMIWHDEDHGETRFHIFVEFPIYRSQDLSKRTPTDTSPARAPETFRILYAEDNPDNQLIIKRLLEKAGHNVDIAENGAVAFEMFQKHPYDVVLMDIQMPVMDGFEATRRIRAWEKEQHRAPTPILALTAHALSDYFKRAIEAGMDDFITKPVKKDILYRMIQSWKKPHSAILAIGLPDESPEWLIEESAAQGFKVLKAKNATHARYIVHRYPFLMLLWFVDKSSIRDVITHFGLIQTMEQARVPVIFVGKSDDLEYIKQIMSTSEVRTLSLSEPEGKIRQMFITLLKRINLNKVH